MNKNQQLFNDLRKVSISSKPTCVKAHSTGAAANQRDEPAWLDIFDEITDGLDNPSVDDLARAVAATCVRCGTEPDWNTYARLMPEGMATLVHAYRAYQDDARAPVASRQVAA